VKCPGCTCIRSWSLPGQSFEYPEKEFFIHDKLFLKR
jgi:hypothetical protein